MDKKNKMKRFRSEDIDICYTDKGAGQPVVLVHGYTASSEMWSEFPQLDGFRIIKMDCRGHGASDKPTRPDDYGNRMAEDVYRLIHHLGLNKVHLVGYSMGAEIALRFATWHPDRLRSLVIAGSGWSQQADADNYMMMSKALIDKGSFAEVLLSWSPDASDQEVEAIVSLMGRQDPAVLAAVAAGMPNILCLPADAFSTLTIPTLGLAGEWDPERANVERLRDVISDFSMAVIDEADHMTAIADPAFYRSIASFLRNA